MVRFDEFIWYVSSVLKKGKLLIHQERDVIFDISSFDNKEQLTDMIKGLLGQDAQCCYSNELTIIPFNCGSQYIWALASGGKDRNEYYSVLLIPLE